MIQETVLHYKILEKLGEGGMGIVFKAHDTKLDRIVALKFLSPSILQSEEDRARLLREAKAASAINHPNVCIIYGVEEFNGEPFIVMEYVEGSTIRQKGEGGALPLTEALRYAREICEALREAHRRGIVHRDIKTENILINQQGHVKVMDFGLAKLKDVARLTRSTSTVGTLAYMAPEQIQGEEVDARADIFSFGVVLYEMLTGHLPFRGVHEAAMMYSILHEEPEPISKFRDVPAQLQKIISKSLEKERSSRFQSAEEILVELNTLAVFPAMKAEVKQGLRESLSWRNTAGRTLTLASACLLLIIALVVYLARNHMPASDNSQYLPQDRMMRKDAGDTGSRAPVENRRRKEIEAGRREVRGRAIVPLPSASGKSAKEAAQEDLSAVREEKASVSAVEGYRIAVLPFSNISPDEKDDYFADGMTEELISTLSRIPRLRVIARTSIMQYKGSKKSISNIGDELKVKAVLEGSVRKSGTKLRITAQLIEVQSQEDLWSEVYDRELNDVFEIQSDVARNVAGTLQMHLPVSGKSIPENLEAYTLYLQGRYSWNKRFPADLLASIEYFKKSAQRDSAYALAYAGLADSYTLLGNYYVLPPNDAYPKAKAAASRALRLDESLAEAHTALAFALMHYDRDWTAAEAEFLRAIELNPSYAVAHSWYAYFLTVVGRGDESLPYRQRAQELDPLSVVISSDAGLTFYFGRKFDETIRHFRKVLELDPSFVGAYIPLGGAYLHQGKFKEAVSSFNKATVFSHDHPIPTSALAYAYAVTGRKSEALKIAEELKKRSGKLYVSPYWLGIIFAGLGDNDEAFLWFDRAIEDHDGSVIFFKMEPILDSLRTDPRYGQLLKKLGFEQ